MVTLVWIPLRIQSFSTRLVRDVSPQHLTNAFTLQQRLAVIAHRNASLSILVRPFAAR